jgi:hypothetical protein
MINMMILLIICDQLVVRARERVTEDWGVWANILNFYKSI